MGDLFREFESESEDQAYQEVVTSDEEFQEGEQDNFFSGITKVRVPIQEKKEQIMKSTIEKMKPDEEDISKVYKTTVT